MPHVFHSHLFHPVSLKFPFSLYKYLRDPHLHSFPLCLQFILLSQYLVATHLDAGTEDSVSDDQ